MFNICLCLQDVGGKKSSKKKRKRITDLNASDDSGDGDSGSDFVLSEKSESEPEEVDSSDYDSGLAQRRKPTRRSTRDEP